MSQTTLKRNKALVLEGFDTLFNERDYEAAQRYWSPDLSVVLTNYGDPVCSLERLRQSIHSTRSSRPSPTPCKAVKFCWK